MPNEIEAGSNNPILAQLASTFRTSSTITWAFSDDDQKILNFGGGLVTDFYGIDPMPDSFVDLNGSSFNLLRGVIQSAMDIVTSYANVSAFETSASNNPYAYVYGSNMPNITRPDGSVFQPNGYATLPTPTSENAAIALDVVDQFNASTNLGSYTLKNAMHEILHIFGLLHIQGEHNNTSVYAGSFIDNPIYSIMSYKNPWGGDSVSSYGDASGWTLTPMALDIAALHHLYGSKAKAVQNTSYHFDPLGANDPNPQVDNKVSTKDGYLSIWDTSGIDLLSFAASTDRSMINLNNATLTLGSTELNEELSTQFQISNLFATLPEWLKVNLQHQEFYAGGALSTTFTTAGMGKFGFTIAAATADHPNAVIENAIGSNQADVVIGNGVLNELYGGGGDDLILGMGGDDIISGGSGDDELHGGSGRDKVNGGSGNDTIFVGRDGDIVDGGEDDDHVYIDTNIGYTYGWSHGATVRGGAGTDTIHISSGQLTVWDKFDFWKGWIAGIEYFDVEKIEIDGTVFETSAIASNYFTGGNPALNAVLGTSTNSGWAAVESATYVVDVATTTHRVFYGAFTSAQDIPENAVITSVSGTLDLGPDTDYALDVAITSVNGSWWLEAVLPTSLSLDFDALDITHAIGSADYAFTYDYDVWVPNANGDGYHKETWEGSGTATSSTGFINGYDRPMTQLSAPDIVYTDRFLDGSLSTAELRFTHDGLERSRPVIYSIISDTSDLLRIDPETGVVTGKTENLFPNGKTIYATVQATDGITTLTKDVEIVMDTTIEVAPVIIGGNTAHETLPFEGQPVGQWLVWDPNYPTGDSTPLVDEISVTFETIGASNTEPLLRAVGLWHIELARIPDESEIGVPLQVKMIVTDDTGQTTESVLSFTIDPVEATINGTTGSDTLQADSYSARTFTINGLGGNDDLSSNNKDHTTLNGGNGDDTLSLNSDYSFANGGTGNDTIWFAGLGHTIEGGDGDDTIDTFGMAVGTEIIGGTGADFIRVASTSATIVYDSISDSYLNDAVLDEGDGPTGEWDIIALLGDDDVIDLSALGEIEWADGATSSTSALAYILEEDEGNGFFLLDKDQDGDFDFGIEFQLVQAQDAIRFIGLNDYILGV